MDLVNSSGLCLNQHNGKYCLKISIVNMVCEASHMGYNDYKFLLFFKFRQVQIMSVALFLIMAVNLFIIRAEIII